MPDYLGSPKVQYFDTNTQEFLVGGKLYSYVAGTDTPTPTYPTPADESLGTNANANPVILDTRGEAAIVLSGPTKLVLRDSLDNVIWTQDGLLSSSSVSTATVLPAGCVMWYAGSVLPTGWLECDGAAISRETYANLFANIGTTYGVGDGTETFNVPNSARRTLVGRGGVTSATLANTIGATGGSETHALTSAENGPHTHNANFPQSSTYAGGGSTGAILEAPTLLATTSSGSGTPHNNIQPSLVMMMIIKAA